MAIVKSSLKASICAPADWARWERRWNALWPAETQCANHRSDVLCLFGGHHERLPGSGYDWHGLRRGVDPAKPFVAFQLTLAGQGSFWDASTGIHHDLTPGSLFAAVLPSDHRYFLPEHSPGWRFVWCDIMMPAAVARVATAARTATPVVHLSTDAPLAALYPRLFALIDAGASADELQLEQTIMEAAWAFAVAARDADPNRSVRHHLIRCAEAELAMHPCPAVEALAKRAGLTRSAFTRAFHAAVGEPPARWLLGRRLARARHLLAATDHDLGTIATTCGFADATHLGKAFRRQFHLTPGRWRAQG